MIDFQQLDQQLSPTSLDCLSPALKQKTQLKLEQYTHGELAQWQDLMQALPKIEFDQFDLKDAVSIGNQSDLLKQLSNDQVTEFTQQLKQLCPWRKGPFDLFGIHIDTEWRSDWKWQRLLSHIAPLKNRVILDVGCGNGYHAWRMLGEQAKLVIGIDPSQKFLAQFSIIKNYLPESAIHLLPLGIEDMPEIPEKIGFDSVFSMGVLYHRKSPLDHLTELKNLLRPGGELIMETLIIDGDKQSVLIPQDRYAQMRNVWFIPSVELLELWLARVGFTNIRTVDINQTSTQEQRATEWMQFQSLENFLDPEDLNKTIEGYPAPTRAITIANIE